MAHRTGQNRQQFGLPFRMTMATPLDEMISPDNLVRVIGAFVDDYFEHGRPVETGKGRFLGHFGPLELCRTPECGPGPGKFRGGVALKSGSHGKGRCAGVGKGDFFHNLRSMQSKKYKMK